MPLEPRYLLVEKVFTGVSVGEGNAPRLILHLEDGRKFYMENVSYDIFVSIRRNLGEELFDDERAMITDIIENSPEFIATLSRNLRYVAIDGFNPEKGVYSATVEFANGKVCTKRVMIPSHAIYLALITGKPIYVSKQLVDEQERLYRIFEELSRLEDGEDDSE
ncbi:MAG: hypothetical protein QXP68_05215 [Thermosphaera sp.]